MTNLLPVIDRGDGRIEILCKHGCGHPSKTLSQLFYGDRKPWQDLLRVKFQDGTIREDARPTRKANGRTAEKANGITEGL